MIAKFYSLFLVCSRISVTLLRFPRTRISSDRKHLIITDLTTRARKHYSCAMGMTMSDYENFLMAESSIWWVVLGDSTNVFCSWYLFMGLQVWINSD